MEDKNDYVKLFDAIDSRFPNAKFVISCFKSIDEIETKVLNDTDEYIIYCDEYDDYSNATYNKRTKKWTNEKILKDKLLIKRLEGKTCITYADVIDQLIEYDFIRNDCDHQFLENIRLSCYDNLKRNKNSLKCYSSFWGS
jgi:hypothetical protein